MAFKSPSIGEAHPFLVNVPLSLLVARCAALCGDSADSHVVAIGVASSTCLERIVGVCLAVGPVGTKTSVMAVQITNLGVL